MKDIIITGYTMENFYAAGIFQTTLAYATAFKKMGHNVKILIKDTDDINKLKKDPNQPLTWLGIEYISMQDVLKLDHIDYLIYMGFIFTEIEEGGNGSYEAVRERFKDAKFVYASFYNIPSGLVAGITNETGYLSVQFKNFTRVFDEMWVLESHMKGTRELLGCTYGKDKVKNMPLLVLEKKDYIQEYSNNTVPAVDISHYDFDLSKCSPKHLLNVDPHSRLKHGFVPIVGSLEWMRKEKGRQMVIGNAFPLWVNPDGNTNVEVHEYFKRYMKETMTGEEYYAMIKQNPDTPVKFYSRHPIHTIVQVSNAFAVVICVIGDWERWNVLLMDLFRMGVPVIHNFKDIDVGWKYEFPDTDGLNAAIEQCQQDLFENNLYDSYKQEARAKFEELSTLKSKEEELAKLIP